MRHISLFLAIVLTLTGLSQGHARPAMVFPENETRPLAKTTLWAEYAGRNDPRPDAEPAFVTDATDCRMVDARLAACAGLLSGIANPAQDPHPAGASNHARAPPPVA